MPRSGCHLRGPGSPSLQDMRFSTEQCLAHRERPVSLCVVSTSSPREPSRTKAAERGLRWEQLRATAGTEGLDGPSGLHTEARLPCPKSGPWLCWTLRAGAGRGLPG